jgi:molybdate-binding protein
MIASIEAGKFAPSAAGVIRLAKALGCRVEDLFWLDEDLPVITARPSALNPPQRGDRVALARVGNGWVAHSLSGERAFRHEMAPADGIAEPIAGDDIDSVKLLQEPAAIADTVAIAGCTPALSLWARSAERWYPRLRLQWFHANSTEALGCLARREVHAAGLHMRDPVTGEHNVPYVRHALKGIPTTLVNLGTWQEGFVVRAGNPLNVQSAGDLANEGVRLVNREPGAGARLLLDTLLDESGVAPNSIQGYNSIRRTHQEIASDVLSGHADVGMSIESVAAAYGLSFVPMREVRYDLAFLTEYLSEQPVQQALEALRHRWVKSQLRFLGGFDTAMTGEIMAQE